MSDLYQEAATADVGEAGPLEESYRRLIDELRRRGWLDDDT
jgi:hypothetical protein